MPESDTTGTRPHRRAVSSRELLLPRVGVDHAVLALKQPRRLDPAVGLFVVLERVVGDGELSKRSLLPGDSDPLRERPRELRDLLLSAGDCPLQPDVLVGRVQPAFTV